MATIRIKTIMSNGEVIDHTIKPTPVKPTFKVGDYVIITESKTNWNSTMDNYVGSIVKITETYLLSNGKTLIEFEGGGNWYWTYEDGHFQPVEAPVEYEEDTEDFKFGVNTVTLNYDTEKVYLNGDEYDYTFEDFRGIIEAFDGYSLPTGNYLGGWSVRVSCLPDSILHIGCKEGTVSEAIEILDAIKRYL